MRETGRIPKTGEKNLQNDFDLLFFHANEDANIDYYPIQLAEEYRTPKISHSNMGDTYTISYIGINDDMEPYLDYTFDAVLLDPITYVSNCAGAHIQGCIMRKSEKSDQFFQLYIKNPEVLIDMIGLEMVEVSD